MKITNEVINKANENDLSVEEVVILYNIYFDKAWELKTFPTKLTQLKNRGILLDEFKLTDQGERVLLSIIEERSILPNQNKTPTNSNFEEIWMLFPKDDSWGRFQSTRLIRTGKPQAKQEYLNALQSITHEELIQALKNEVSFRKNAIGENKLKYMKKAANWFKDQSYMDFLDEDTEEDETEDRNKVL